MNIQLTKKMLEVFLKIPYFRRKLFHEKLVQNRTSFL